MSASPAPIDTAPLRRLFPHFDQVVKGNVTIKKISKHKYKITFSKIGKFLVYETWDKDNTDNINSNRLVNYLPAKNWVQLFNIMNKVLHLFSFKTPILNEITYK